MKQEEPIERARVRVALEHLSWDAEHQQRYVAKIFGLAKADFRQNIDELALELDDAWLTRSTMLSEGAISLAEAEAVDALLAHLQSFSGEDNAELWEAVSLFSAPKWAETRELARRALGHWDVDTYELKIEQEPIVEKRDENGNAIVVKVPEPK